MINHQSTKKNNIKEKFVKHQGPMNIRFFAEIKCYWEFAFKASGMSDSLPVKVYDAETYCHFVVCCNKYHA